MDVRQVEDINRRVRLTTGLGVSHQGNPCSALGNLRTVRLSLSAGNWLAPFPILCRGLIFSETDEQQVKMTWSWGEL